MDIKQQTTITLTLSHAEAQTIQLCLDYAWHRLKQHPEAGIQGRIKHKEVDKLRNELRPYTNDQ